MRICLINPNSTESMTRTILAAAQGFASGVPALEVRAVTCPRSPSLINSDAEEVEAAYWTLAAARAESPRADAFVIGCHSDPALSAVCEATGKPAAGIGSASMLAAARLGGLPAVLVISGRSVPRKTRMLRRLGIGQKFLFVPCDYSEDMPQEAVFERLLSRSRDAVAEGATSVTLGCAGMSEATRFLREQLAPVPVIDGVEEAIRSLLIA